MMHTDNFPVRKLSERGTSLVVQWLRLYASTAGGTGSIPCQGTKILHVACQGQKKKIQRHRGTYKAHAFMEKANDGNNLKLITKFENKATSLNILKINK